LNATRTASATGFRLLLLAGFAVLSGLRPAGASGAARLERVRIGVTPERTRLVLDLSDGDWSYSRRALGDSALDLTLSGATLGSGFTTPSPGQGLLRRLRAFSEKGQKVRLRMSLLDSPGVSVFRLDRGGENPDRLVVDLRPRQGAGRAPGSPATGSPSGSAATGGEADSAAPALPAAAPVPEKIRVVVIDPGHGGADPGAVAKNLREKDVCLDVAKRLAAALREAKGIRAILTRSEDVAMPLKQRLLAGEREDADLFLSIHVNAARSRVAHGVEVYFLSVGAASDAASRELARLENEADPDYVVSEDEGLKTLPFLVDLRQSDTMLRSSRAAEVMLDLMTERKLAQARGVKQAGFAVLKSFQVPSVLVELGFISSLQDRAQLQKPEYRQRLAQALADGIRRYFQEYAPHRSSGTP